MIKSLIILVLVVLLAGGAALTCPSEASFKTWYTQRSQAEGGNMVEKLFQQSRIDSYLKGCTYKNRVVFSQVTKDGKSVATGVFDHWFPSDSTMFKASSK